MKHSCWDKLTIRSTHERKSTYKFEVCDKHKTNPDFEKHVGFIGKYCYENNLDSLSFKRTKKGRWDGDCSFYNPLDFMTLVEEI